MTVLATSGPVAAAPVTPFNYAVVDIFAGGPSDGTTATSSSSAPVFSERGALPGAYGKARAQFGSTGFALLSGAGAASMWSDGFLVAGSSGPGLMNLSVRIDGSVLGSQPDMSYTLFVSANPFDAQTILDSLALDDQNPQVPGAAPVLHTEVFHEGFHPQGALNVALLGSLPFTYGQTLYLASVFGGDVCGPGCGDGQGEDFFNSATFGITVPSGATLSAVSGTIYAAAVPEPATWMLVCAGLAGMVAVSRRRVPTRDRR